MAALLARRLIAAQHRLRIPAGQLTEQLGTESRAYAPLALLLPDIQAQTRSISSTQAQLVSPTHTQYAQQQPADAESASQEASTATSASSGTDKSAESGQAETGTEGAEAGSSSTADGQTDGQTAAGDQEKGSKASVGDRLRHIATVVWREVKEAVSPQEEVTSALRAPAAADVAPQQEYSGTTAVVLGKQQESAWQKQFRDVSEKLSGHPFFKRISGLKQHTVFQKGQEVAENIRERWETSDNPLVHKIQDMSDSMFSENEPARALREIRTRDPNFDLVKFLVRIKGDVVPVIQAYLTGKGDVLEQYCSPEMVERLMGIVKAMQAQNLYSDSTILDISEVELVDLKFLEDQPIVVVQFNCQQINCSRDKFGNVVDGAPDSVHRVYYYWALQQDEQGYTGTDGNFYPPRWVLKEMLPAVVDSPENPVENSKALSLPAEAAACSTAVPAQSPATDTCLVTQGSTFTSQQSNSTTPGHISASPAAVNAPNTPQMPPTPPQQQQQYTYDYDPYANQPQMANRHPADAINDPLAGQTRYKKLHDLGAGTYGFVVLAHDTKMGDYCAVKFLERGRTLGKMVEREILSHRLCSAHPNIVRFREVFLTPRYLAIAMEYAAGGDLFEYTLQNDGHVNENEARRLFQQVISAVAFCHANGVVNRDIKLENALLKDSGPMPMVKLCDFGYSKNEHVDSACKTAAGTPEYVAPEMVLTQGNYNGKSADVWSCGVFLYVMLNGAYPFHTEPGDKLAIKRMVKGIYKFHVDVSPACQDIVSRMLIPNPQDRITMVDILRHPWFLRNLSPELRDLNRRLVGHVPQTIQTEEEIKQVVLQAQTIDMPQTPLY